MEYLIQKEKTVLIPLRSQLSLLRSTLASKVSRVRRLMEEVGVGASAHSLSNQYHETSINSNLNSALHSALQSPSSSSSSSFLPLSSSSTSSVSLLKHLEVVREKEVEKDVEKEGEKAKYLPCSSLGTEEKRKRENEEMEIGTEIEAEEKIERESEKEREIERKKDREIEREREVERSRANSLLDEGERKVFELAYALFKALRPLYVARKNLLKSGRTSVSSDDVAGGTGVGEGDENSDDKKIDEEGRIGDKDGRDEVVVREPITGDATTNNNGGGSGGLSDQNNGKQVNNEVRSPSIQNDQATSKNVNKDEKMKRKSSAYSRYGGRSDEIHSNSQNDYFQNTSDVDNYVNDKINNDGNDDSKNSENNDKNNDKNDCKKDESEEEEEDKFLSLEALLSHNRWGVCGFSVQSPLKEFQSNGLLALKNLTEFLLRFKDLGCQLGFEFAQQRYRYCTYSQVAVQLSKFTADVLRLTPTPFTPVSAPIQHLAKQPSWQLLSEPNSFQEVFNLSLLSFDKAWRAMTEEKGMLPDINTYEHCLLYVRETLEKIINEVRVNKRSIALI